MAPANQTDRSNGSASPSLGFQVADSWNANLYLVNCALLFAHQIDSAYWHEWNLFRMPGGIQVFVLVNLALLLLALYGHREIVRGARAGYVFALVLAAGGLFALVFHTVMLLKGHPEFRLPVSLALLAVIPIVSIAQGIGAVVRLRRL